MSRFLTGFAKLSVRVPMTCAGTAVAAAGVVGVSSYLAASRHIADPAALQAVGQQMLWSGVIALPVIAISAWLAGRQSSRPVNALRDAANRIAQGDFAPLPYLERGGEIGDLARALQALGERGLEAARIRTALDGLRSNLMISDAENRIVYVNKSLLRFFSDAQDDFRQTYPGIAAKDMIGSVLELLRADLAGPKAMVDASGARALRFQLGSRIIALSMTEISDASGKKLGGAIEWLEMTDELRIADEISGALQATTDGDFSRRLKPEGKSEAMRRIAESVNQAQWPPRRSDQRGHDNARHAGRR